MTNQRYPFLRDQQVNLANQLTYRMNNSHGVGTFLVYKNADQTNIASGDKITFPAEDYDVSGWFHVGSSAYEPKQSGYYAFFTNMAISTAALTANKHHSLHLYKNGAYYAVMGHAQVAVNTDDLQLYGSVIVDADPGDYFEMYFFHNQAGNPTIRKPADHQENYFCGHFLGYRGA